MHTWTVYKGRLNTRGSLIRKGFVIDNNCVLCNSFEENLDHLFINCGWISSIWNSIYFNFQCNLHFESISQIWSDYGSNLSLEFNLYKIATIWMVWKERNCRIFNNKQMSSLSVLRDISSLAFFGSKNLSGNYLKSFLSFSGPRGVAGKRFFETT